MQVEFRCPFFEHHAVLNKKSVFFVGKSGNGICLNCWKQTTSFEQLINELDAVRGRGGKPDPNILPCFLCKTKIATTSIPNEIRHMKTTTEPIACEICEVCRVELVMDFEAEKMMLPYIEQIMSDGSWKRIPTLLDELEKVEEVKAIITRERLESILDSSGRILRERDPASGSLYVYKWIKQSTKRTAPTQNNGIKAATLDHNPPVVRCPNSGDGYCGADNLEKATRIICRDNAN